MSDPTERASYSCPPIRVLVGLEAVRLRPGMYMGPERVTASRLGAVAIVGMVRSGAGANAVVAEVREDGSLTVRAAGALAPMGTHARDGIEQPALLDAMLTLVTGGPAPWLGWSGPVLAALSAPLGISCRRDGRRLDAWFARGGLVEAVRVSADPREDTTAIAVVPDATLLPGAMDVESLRRELVEVDAEAAAFVEIRSATGEFWSALGPNLASPLWPAEE